MSTKRGRASLGRSKRPRTNIEDEKSPTRKKTKCDDIVFKFDGHMATAILEIVTRHLRSASNAHQAARMSKYMRNKFPFYGIRSPELRKIFKEKILPESPDIKTSRQLRCLLLVLWDERERECQHIAFRFAEKHLGLLRGDTVEDCNESVDCVTRMITTKSWWDTVDFISSDFVGYLAKERPAVLNPIFEDWIKDKNMWLRRTAILHQLKYKNTTDQDKLFRFCLLRCHEKEFFIQKAIGWALRNHFRFAPEAVKDFVKKNEDKLATLSKKEALKHA